MPASSILELQRQYGLLELEYNHEKATYLEENERISPDRKISRGICWHPLSIGRSYYNSLNQFVVEVHCTEHLDTEHHFEYGRPLMFFDADIEHTRIRYLNFPATVSYADDNRMVVVLPGPEALNRLNEAVRPGVQLGFDENVYKLMFASLRAAMQDKDGRLAELRDIFHGMRPAGELVIPPMRFPWLNPSQENAVNKVLRAKDVAIVHGPPGTGKTTTLVEAVYETLHRENQVLVCAQSNMAVDWISEKLVDRGIPVLRIGNPVRVNDKMLSFTYERRFEAHPDYPLLHSIRRAIRQLYDSRKGGRSESIRQKINALRDRADDLEMRIQESLFAEARVIAWLAGEEWVLDVFRAGGDVYCATAGQMFHCRVEKHGENAELRPKGKIAVLALGYGGGRAALEAMGGSRMGLSLTEMEDIRDRWRSANPNIVRLWSTLERAALRAIKYGERITVNRGVELSHRWGMLLVRLPSGRTLCYPRARIEEVPDRWKGTRDGIVYEGQGQTTRKWEAQRTYGGKLTENVVQAIARDILGTVILRAEAAGLPIVFHVHDEIIVEAAPGQSLEQVEALFSTPIDWCPGLPLTGAGYTTEYYLKD